MGAGAAGRLTAASGISGTTLGAFGGIQSQSIAQNQLPNIIPTFSGTSVVITTDSKGGNIVQGTIVGTQLVQGGNSTGAATGSGFSNSGIKADAAYTPAGTITSINGNVAQVAQTNLQPTRLCTFYLKL